MKIFLIFIPFILFLFFLGKNIYQNKKEREGQDTQKELTDKQKKFKSFTPEIQWTIIKPFLDIFNLSVSNKMATLPSFSAIAVMMMIIATLSPELMPINPFHVKIIISVLLFLIPYCLLIYLWDMQDAAERALEDYEEYTGSNIRKKLNIGFYNYIKGSSPAFALSVYTAIIIFLLEIIWGIL